VPLDQSGDSCLTVRLRESDNKGDMFGIEEFAAPRSSQSACYATTTRLAG